MSIEKKMVRSDIPGSHVFLNANVGYVGSTNSEARRLVIGKDISLQGQVSSCDYIVIEGVVQAEAFSSRRMEILELGFFCGRAEVHDCVIAGRFEGKLLVSGRLTVKSTGQIYGEIEYGTLEVETGAKIDARLLPVALPVIEESPALLSGNVEQLIVTEKANRSEVAEHATIYRRAAGK